jgi:hypothetical protein
MNLTVAIASDLHFYTESLDRHGKPSWLGLKSDVMPPQYTDPSNPWNDIAELIKHENLHSDLVISPGDITTYADRNGLNVAWSCLVDLAKSLNAHLVAAATGNHDVSSRPMEISTDIIRGLDKSVDRFENLKSLKPEYPLHYPSANGSAEAHAHRIHYFGSGYIMVDNHDAYRLIVLNSCVQHTSEASEYERGCIANTTRQWLNEQLAKIDWSQRKLNFLVCHHHPIQHEDHHLGSYDFMKDGSLLLADLAKHGDWIVFHGHKHHGKLSYAQGVASSPVVFAASSFAALAIDAGARIKNQFYLIDIELDPSSGPPRGTIRAWNWFAGKGWERAVSIEDGIYFGCGFGDRRHPDDVADEIKNKITVPMAWKDVTLAVPCLKYITPSDLKKIGVRLIQQHSLRIEDERGVISEIARIA